MQSCLELIPDDAQRIFVAFSGGLDSTVLLHLLVADSRKFEIIPWHFNHGLLDVASDMEQFCIEQTRRLGLEIRVDQLRLDKVESNVEAVARHNRYALFAQHTRAGDCILTAHHADDQAETFLLNALRGSGSAGLRGIARQRVLDGGALLLRPLLDSSRSQLETYARQHKLAWVDDPRGADRVFRGGGWNDGARGCRSAFRVHYTPGVRSDGLGFRLALGQAAPRRSQAR